MDGWMDGWMVKVSYLLNAHLSLSYLIRQLKT